MPIYEFYCCDCHTVFSFLAKSPSNDRRPDCPKCGRLALDKQVSRFAISRGLSDPAASDPFEGMDESKLESAFDSMAHEFESMNEEDPRQMAGMMRKLFETSGLEPNETIREAMRRMESGEDPDKVEEEMGAVLDSEDPLAQLGGKQRTGYLRRFFEPPNIDPDLYDFPTSS